MIGPNPNFKIFNEEIEFKLKEIGELIGVKLPPGWGFSLLLFDFNAGANGSLFYTSNGLREDVLKMMREFIKLQEEKDAKDQINPQEPK